MSGRVEIAVRARIRPGEQLHTAANASPFTVKDIDHNGVVLLLGKGRWPVRLNWRCLEGIPTFLRDRGWVRIGSLFSSTGEAGTLDGYLKNHTKVLTAGWVAALLDRACVVEIDRSRPAKVRLRPGFHK